ncbi:MAG: HPP family protein [Gemmataceae bacterium]
MITSPTSIRPLVAANIMTTDLIMIPKHMCLAVAARILSQHHISGAPVVDDDGRCIGVLSAQDFLRWVERGGGGFQPKREALLEICPSWQIVDVETDRIDEVGNFMTPDPVTVSLYTPVAEIARMMIEVHIHRVIVVDDKDRPQGIITSTDILSILARDLELSSFH